MLFKEAIAQALEHCEIGSGYNVCDNSFGSALANVLTPIAQKYNITNVIVSTGYGKGNKKLSMSATYNDGEISAYTNHVMHFDVKRFKGQQHHKWGETWYDYKVVDARTAEGEFDDTNIDEFFKKLAVEDVNINKAREVSDLKNKTITENEDYIATVAEALSKLKENPNKEIIMREIRERSGVYVSCY